MDLTKLLANNSINSSECAVILLLESKPATLENIRYNFYWSRTKTYRILQNLIDKNIVKKIQNEYELNPTTEWKIPENGTNCYKNEINDKFNDLFTRNLQNDLKNYLLHKHISPDDCDDIIQESSLKALKGMYHFNDSNFRGWIFQITKNTMKDYFKKKRPYQLFENEEIIDENTTDPEYLQFIEKLNNLPNHFKIPLLLSRVYEVPYKDIAIYCGVTEVNIRVRISRAISLLG